VLAQFEAKQSKVHGDLRVLENNRKLVLKGDRLSEESIFIGYNTISCSCPLPLSGAFELVFRTDCALRTPAQERSEFEDMAKRV